MTRTLLVPLIAALGLPGCFLGQTGTRVFEDTGVAGGEARLHFPDKRVLVASLVAVGDSSMIVDNGTYVVVPYRDIVESHIGGHSARDSDGFAVPPRDRINMYARHPYGLDTEQLRALLATRDQAALHVIRGVGVREEAVTPEAFAGRLRRPIEHRHHAVAAPADDVFDAFLDTLRQAVVPLSSIEAASAAGYRKLGPEFPGMGEHWIHPGLIVAGRVDPKRPSVLGFARIGEERRLVNVSFTVPLQPGDSPPEYPAGRHVWHDHSGSVDEELLLLAHPVSHAVGATGQPRLAMFHVWIGLENDAGILAQNNWRLPFVQAGLTLAEVPGVDAARGLSLSTAGPEYYLTLFDAAGDLSEQERARVAEVLERSAATVAAWRSGQGKRSVGREELAVLAGFWSSLWSDLRGELAPATYARLAPLGGETATSARRRLGFGDLSARAYAGNGFFVSDRSLPMFGFGVALRVTERYVLRLEMERGGVDNLGTVCWDRCYAAPGSGSITFWNVGLDQRLLRFGSRGEFWLSGGVGSVSLDRPGDVAFGDQGSGLALLIGLLTQWRIMPALALRLDAVSYTTETATGEMLQHPIVRLGLEASQP